MIHWLTKQELPTVLEIERLSFDNPWVEQDFRSCLQHSFCLTMESAGEVVGFVVYELNKKNFTILNLAVHPDHRRQGVGANLIDHLKVKLTKYCRKSLSLLLRESSSPAQKFFASQAFKAVQLVRSYYKDTGEDAYKMVYSLYDVGFFRCTNRISQYQVEK
jgi:ribosomal-protein-alanine N-acetyltransferase